MAVLQHHHMAVLQHQHICEQASDTGHLLPLFRVGTGLSEDERDMVRSALNSNVIKKVGTTPVSALAPAWPCLHPCLHPALAPACTPGPAGSSIVRYRTLCPMEQTPEATRAHWVLNWSNCDQTCADESTFLLYHKKLPLDDATAFQAGHLSPFTLPAAFKVATYMPSWQVGWSPQPPVPSAAGPRRAASEAAPLLPHHRHC
jgi:hypothetical protein